VNFLVDSQLPPALARWIAAQGHSAKHVFDLGLASADDFELWELARREHAVIISKDEDFADLWSLRGEGVGLVWLRKGNCSNRALMEWLTPLWPEVLQRLEQGETFVELRA
jgi:predicted nuclease of predicted toxin-antitoxin system